MKLKSESEKRWQPLLAQLKEAAKAGEARPALNRQIVLHFDRPRSDDLRLVIPEGTEVTFFNSRSNLSNGKTRVKSRTPDLDYFMFSAQGYQLTYRYGAWLLRKL